MLEASAFLDESRFPATMPDAAEAFEPGAPYRLGPATIEVEPGAMAMATTLADYSPARGHLMELQLYNQWLALKGIASGHDAQRAQARLTELSAQRIAGSRSAALAAELSREGIAPEQAPTAAEAAPEAAVDRLPDPPSADGVDVELAWIAGDGERELRPNPENGMFELVEVAADGRERSRMVSPERAVRMIREQGFAADFTPGELTREQAAYARAVDRLDLDAARARSSASRERLRTETAKRYASAIERKASGVRAQNPAIAARLDQIAAGLRDGSIGVDAPAASRLAGAGKLAPADMAALADELGIAAEGVSGRPAEDAPGLATEAAQAPAEPDRGAAPIGDSRIGAPAEEPDDEIAQAAAMRAAMADAAGEFGGDIEDGGFDDLADDFAADLSPEGFDEFYEERADIDAAIAEELYPGPDRGGAGGAAGNEEEHLEADEPAPEFEDDGPAAEEAETVPTAAEEAAVPTAPPEEAETAEALAEEAMPTLTWSVFEARFEPVGDSEDGEMEQIDVESDIALDLASGTATVTTWHDGLESYSAELSAGEAAELIRRDGFVPNFEMQDLSAAAAERLRSLMSADAEEPPDPAAPGAPEPERKAVAQEAIVESAGEESAAEAPMAGTNRPAEAPAEARAARAEHPAPYAAQVNAGGARRAPEADPQATRAEAAARTLDGMVRRASMPQGTDAAAPLAGNGEPLASARQLGILADGVRSGAILPDDPGLARVLETGGDRGAASSAIEAHAEALGLETREQRAARQTAGRASSTRPPSPRRRSNDSSAGRNAAASPKPSAHSGQPASPRAATVAGALSAMADEARAQEDALSKAGSKGLPQTVEGERMASANMLNAAAWAVSDGRVASDDPYVTEIMISGGGWKETRTLLNRRADQIGLGVINGGPAQQAFEAQASGRARAALPTHGAESQAVPADARDVVTMMLPSTFGKTKGGKPIPTAEFGRDRRNGRAQVKVTLPPGTVGSDGRALSAGLVFCDPAAIASLPDGTIEVDLSRSEDATVFLPGGGKVEIPAEELALAASKAHRARPQEAGAEHGRARARARAEARGQAAGKTAAGPAAAPDFEGVMRQLSDLHRDYERLLANYNELSANYDSLASRVGQLEGAPAAAPGRSDLDKSRAATAGDGLQAPPSAPASESSAEAPAPEPETMEAKDPRDVLRSQKQAEGGFALSLPEHYAGKNSSHIRWTLTNSDGLGFWVDWSENLRECMAFPLDRGVFDMEEVGVSHDSNPEVALQQLLGELNELYGVEVSQGESPAYSLDHGRDAGVVLFELRDFLPDDLENRCFHSRLAVDVRRQSARVFSYGDGGVISADISMDDALGLLDELDYGLIEDRSTASPEDFGMLDDARRVRALLLGGRGVTPLADGSTLNPPARPIEMKTASPGPFERLAEKAGFPTGRKGISGKPPAAHAADDARPKADFKSSAEALGEHSPAETRAQGKKPQ